MGFLDHYRQYAGMEPEEVSAQLREAADERRRKALARLEPLNLSVTTWPEYPPPRVVNAITFAARRGLHRYVETGTRELRSVLGERHGVPSQRVVIGEGASQLLSAAAQSLLEPGDELVTPWPSYPLYPVMAHRARGHVVPVGGFGAESVLAAVNDRTRLVALCNPNDPTGELLRVGELDALLGALPERVVVLLDEALRDFVAAEELDATLSLLERHPRLLVFRTFSKAWGLAGLRCGYAIGGAGAEELLAQLAPELGVNELAQAGALEALGGIPELPVRRARALAAQRERLEEALGPAGLRAPSSQANVVWLEAPGPHGGADLAGRLDRAGITVQPGSTWNVPDRVRITIPHRPEDTDRLLRALR